MICAVMPELHLQRARADCQPEYLMPEADSECRNLAGYEFTRRFDRVDARLRIAGAVGEKYTVGLQLGTSLALLGWNDRDVKPRSAIKRKIFCLTP